MNINIWLSSGETTLKIILIIFAILLIFEFIFLTLVTLRKMIIHHKLKKDIRERQASPESETKTLSIMIKSGNVEDIVEVGNDETAVKLQYLLNDADKINHETEKQLKKSFRKTIKSETKYVARLAKRAGLTKIILLDINTLDKKIVEFLNSFEIFTIKDITSIKSKMLLEIISNIPDEHLVQNFKRKEDTFLSVLENIKQYINIEDQNARNQKKEKKQAKENKWRRKTKSDDSSSASNDSGFGDYN